MASGDKEWEEENRPASWCPGEDPLSAFGEVFGEVEEERAHVHRNLRRAVDFHGQIGPSNVLP